MYSILEFSKRINIPFYATEEQLEKINDKKQFKDILVKFGVDVTEEVVVDPSLDKNKLMTIKFPVVVKPVDSSGRKGISYCRNVEELIKAYNYALSESRSKRVIVEKCLLGLPEVFFNYTVIDGQFSLSGAFDKYYLHYENNALIGLPILNSFPSKRIQVFLDTAHTNIISTFKALGIKNGTISVQCFTDEEKFYVYEAGYRLGGGQMYIFTDYFNNINPMKMMVNYALSGKMTDDVNEIKDDNPFFSKPCCQLNVPLKPGIITKLEGVETIRSIKGVLNITQVHKKGDLIKQDGTLGRLCLRIHIVGENWHDLKDIIDKINENLIIEDENGNDMFLERYSPTHPPHTSGYKKYKIDYSFISSSCATCEAA